MNKRKYPIGHRIIRDTFLYSTEKYKDKIGFMEKRPNYENFRKITYSKFRKDVISFGTALINDLELKNERFIIIGENSYEWAVAYYAVVCGAGMVVPIDKELPLDEVITLANRSRATCIIYSSRKRDLIDKLKGKTKLKKFIEMYSDEHLEKFMSNSDNYTFEQIIEKGSKLDEDILLNVKIDENEPKILLFTSGTTSEAKGVMLTNRNIITNIEAAIQIVYLYEKDVFLSVLPLHHSYESTVGMIIPIYNGLTIGYVGGLKSMASDIKQIKPTVMLVVPALIESLMAKINKNIEKKGKTKTVKTLMKITNRLGCFGRKLKKIFFKEIFNNLGGNIRLIVSAAAPIDPEIGKEIEDFGIMFIQGYGLTETSPLATLVPHKKRKIASVGVAAKCCKLKIVNPDENGIGEVYIKGDNVTKGYYENEEATKDSFTDGWFNSGDLGYFDEDGYLFLTGRSKNLILTSNGKNVFPEEIEPLINRIPEVLESMVFAKQDPKDKKEQIIAVKVTLDESYIEEKYKEKRPTDKEMQEIIWNKIKEINKTLVSYKWIKQLIIKKEDFIKTTTMKIKRYEEIKKED